MNQLLSCENKEKKKKLRENFFAHTDTSETETPTNAFSLLLRSFLDGWEKFHQQCGTFVKTQKFSKESEKWRKSNFTSFPIRISICSSSRCWLLIILRTWAFVWGTKQLPRVFTSRAELTTKWEWISHYLLLWGSCHRVELFYFGF